MVAARVYIEAMFLMLGSRAATRQGKDSQRPKVRSSFEDKKMFELIFAVCAIVAIKHLVSMQGPKSKSFSTAELNQLISRKEQAQLRSIDRMGW